MDININLENGNNIVLENLKFQKMIFLFNAINSGWTVRKEQNFYIFNKNHNGKEEIFKKDYLSSFMSQNFDINNILS